MNATANGISTGMPTLILKVCSHLRNEILRLESSHTIKFFTDSLWISQNKYPGDLGVGEPARGY